jgi:hypothetical protein
MPDKENASNITRFRTIKSLMGGIPAKGLNVKILKKTYTSNIYLTSAIFDPTNH